MNSRGNNYQASMNHKAIIFQPFEQQGTRAEQFGTQNCNQTPEAAIRTTAQGEGKSTEIEQNNPRILQNRNQKLNYNQRVSQLQ